MKHLRLTIILALVFLAFGAYVWFFERGEVGMPTASGRATAWRLDPQRVRRIELTSGDHSTVIERAGRQWRIVRPISARVDRSRMTQLLDRVAKIAMRRSFDNPGKLAQYGLARPAASIKLTLAGGERRALLLGDKTPDGAAVYAQERGRARVFLADVALLDDAAAGAAALRDRTALPFDRAGVSRITLTRGAAALTLDRSRSAWRIATPIAAAADSAAVDGLLASLESVEASRFASERAADLSRYGLDRPRLMVKVRSRRGERRLAFGADTGGGEVYAKNSVDPAVMAVPKSALDSVNKTLADLRSKEIATIDADDAQRIAILRGQQRFEVQRVGDKRWQLSSPRPLEADAQKIEDLLWALSGLRAQGFVDHPGPLASYGLEPLRAAVTIYHAHRKQPVRLMFGGTAGTNRIYVKAGDSTIYQAPADILTRLPASANDLRNLTLLSYEPGAISAIRAAYNDKTVVLKRDGTKWRLMQPTRRAANAERMQQLLSIIEHVRAESFVGEFAELMLPVRGIVKLTVEGAGQKPTTLVVWASDGETRLKLEGDLAVLRAAPGLPKQLTDVLDAIVRQK